MSRRRAFGVRWSRYGGKGGDHSHLVTTSRNAACDEWALDEMYRPSVLIISQMAVPAVQCKAEDYD
ncbi:hypothetical protein C1886_19545 [Pseudomonas sp. FW300-N1A1]|nr:hypothetical protein C1886_19545 [Pseudomonas sp. FW300-N1A1]